MARQAARYRHLQRNESKLSNAAPPIRVALVGYGYSGRTFHAPLIGAVDALRLRLVSSPDEAKVLADLPGVAVLPHPTAVATSDEVALVVVASPSDSHAPLARAALLAGNHVVVDNPFTIGLAEALGLVACVDCAAMSKRAT